MKDVNGLMNKTRNIPTQLFIFHQPDKITRFNRCQKSPVKTANTIVEDHLKAPPLLLLLTVSQVNASIWSSFHSHEKSGREKYYRRSVLKMSKRRPVPLASSERWVKKKRSLQMLRQKNFGAFKIPRLWYPVALLVKLHQVAWSTVIWIKLLPSHQA